VGDNAELALIELVDYNDVYGKGTTAPAEATGKRTRRGRGKRGAEGTEAAGTSTAVRQHLPLKLHRLPNFLQLLMQMRTKPLLTTTLKIKRRDNEFELIFKRQSHFRLCLFAVGKFSIIFLMIMIFLGPA
jgi:hypothetical protein